MARTNFLSSLFLPFLLAIFCLFVIPLFFPSWHLTFLAPPLIIVFYQRPLLQTLWYGIFAGIFVDLLGGEKLGFHAASYLLTLLAISPMKTIFFPDRLSTLPFLTACFSTLSTAINFLLLKFLSQGFPFQLSWAFTDLILMPLFDGLYAFFLFTLPGFLPRWPKREYFFSSRER